MDHPLLDGNQFLILVGIVAGMLIVGWIAFFIVVFRKGDGVKDVLEGGGFLQNLTVIAAVIATGLLATIGVVKGELVIALYSAIVGFVLGTGGQSLKRRRTLERVQQT